MKMSQAKSLSTHDQLRITLRTERRDQPEDVGYGEHGGAGRDGCRIAVGQHTGGSGHAFDLQRRPP